MSYLRFLTRCNKRTNTLFQIPAMLFPGYGLEAVGRDSHDGFCDKDWRSLTAN